MVGACIGFVGIIGVRVLVLGDSFDGLHSKFAETGMLETVGVSLLAILILLFSIFLQVLLHEGGHLVCGLATGYRFVSFRIFNLTFIRKDGKLCIKRFSLAGTGGQCLLTPPERPLEDIPTTLYNLGGVLANLLTAILAFLPLLTVDGLPYLLKFFLLMLSLIGILLAGMNGIPMKMGGIGNDADNMRLLLKDSKSKQALVTQLRINALVQEGMRPKDMPAEWFSQTEDINYKDALQVTIALMSASRLLDCEPDIAALEELLLRKARHVLVKLSPMLDLTLALNDLKHVREAHIVSVGNECKELLLLLGQGEGVPADDIPIHCVNFTGVPAPQALVFTRRQEKERACPYTPQLKSYLYEPNASVLKAGAFRSLSSLYKVEKLHPNSHLYTSDHFLPDFPGRKFRITSSCGFGKKEVKEMLAAEKKANLTVRNFPATVAELRKRLKLAEGGGTYLFATTLADEKKVLIRCQATG